jgi:NADH-quinone oxidoreductase subunit H
MAVLLALYAILVFPGLAFLSTFGLVAEYVDRKLYARFQNRIGPPWFQPFADFVKLLGKETIIPAEADAAVFKAIPAVAMAAVVTAMLYIPVWGHRSLLGFNGDLVVVIYLLTIPTLTFFLAGWSSTSLYAAMGAVRSLTQLFAYEVPLYMALLAPALLARTWSLEQMALWYTEHPAWMLANLLGFLVAIVALQGKLEKVPFDIPEAETEIVGGTFTEYSGRLLAVFRMAIDMEMVVGAALLAAVFLPFGLGLHPVLVFLLFLGKVLFLVALAALLRALFARLRIEQMVDFCWRILMPAALLQLLVTVVLSGFAP